MEKNLLKAILISMFMGTIVCVGFLVLISFLFVKTMRLPLDAIDIISLCACVMGASVAGYFCGRLLKEKGFLSGIICGATLFFAIFLSSILFFGEQVTFFALVKLILMMLTGAIGDIIAVNKKERVKRY